jgi:CubicO group peptidase (beta-lactamase class C family)
MKQERFSQLTSLQLLNHKSGIRHYKGTDEWVKLMLEHCQTPNDAIQYFIKDPLIEIADEKEHYSSFGYVLLSAVMEASSGQSLEILMEKYLFNKSHVDRVDFDDPTNLNIDVNTSLFFEPSNNKQMIAPAANNSCKFGAGNINASPGAISKVFSAFNEGKLSSLKTVELLFSQFASHEAYPKLSLGGEGLGGRSVLLTYPTDNLVIVIAANARGGNLQPYANEIANIVRIYNQNSKSN